MTRISIPIRLAAPALTVLLAAGCGGGDSDAAGDDGRPSVASATVSGAKYSQAALITISGTNLDGSVIGGTISVASPG